MSLGYFWRTVGHICEMVKFPLTQQFNFQELTLRIHLQKNSKIRTRLFDVVSSLSFYITSEGSLSPLLVTAMRGSSLPVS